MSSLRRILSARANGALSRGLVTAAGKAHSSQNAIRHGLFAECVVLSNESPSRFQAWREQSVDCFGPFDGVDEALIEEMSAAFRSLTVRPEINRIHRYEACFHNIYHRALYNLFLLRTPGMRNEPNNRLKTKKHPGLAPSFETTS
jgi:hypothetical protein